MKILYFQGIEKKIVLYVSILLLAKILSNCDSEINFQPCWKLSPSFFLKFES